MIEFWWSTSIVMTRKAQAVESSETAYERKYAFEVKVTRHNLHVICMRQI